MREPVAISVALGVVLSTSVAVLALLWPEKLTPEMSAAIIALGNAIIGLGVAVFARSQSTPTAAPVLPSGTAVTTPQGQPAKVVKLFDT